MNLSRVIFADAPKHLVHAGERLELVWPGEVPWFDDAMWGGYVYVGPTQVMLSMIISHHPGRGNFRRLCESLWAQSLTVLVTTPVDIMPDILRHMGFDREPDDPRRGFPVWKRAAVVQEAL
jgi:hypothetical protein